MRLSAKGLRALAAILRQGELCGADISRRASVGSGTLYPLLSRGEAAGWLTSRWENVDPSEEGRPRRKFYALTEIGRQRVQAEIAAIREMA